MKIFNMGFLFKKINIFFCFFFRALKFQILFYHGEHVHWETIKKSSFLWLVNTRKMATEQFWDIFVTGSLSLLRTVVHGACDYCARLCDFSAHLIEHTKNLLRASAILSWLVIISIQNYKIEKRTLVSQHTSWCDELVIMCTHFR